MSSNLWAIVLAAGEGRRLAPLTRRLYGTPRPKQFAVLDGDASLLEQTIERLLPLVPPERVVVVLPAEHEEIGRAQLARWPDVHAVVQPRNRGTGPGILLPLAHVLEQDPDATVCICPSDQTFGDPEALRAALWRAAVATSFFRMVLVGVRATRPETEYGWIRVGRGGRHDVRALREFVEKPPEAVATRLLRGRALWNTFLTVGAGIEIWRSAERLMPEQAEAILACMPVTAPTAEQSLAEAYARMEERSFSCDVLEREEALGVVELDDPEWSDLGTPERVLEALDRRGALASLWPRLRLAVPRYVESALAPLPAPDIG